MTPRSNSILQRPLIPSVLIFLFIFFPRFSEASPNLVDLAKQVSSLESLLEDLKPGQEKHFQWVQENDPEITEYALVYLHGFSASRQEISPLVENLAQELKANAFWTRLAGHGLKSPEALGQIHREDWEKDVHEALNLGRQMGKKVIVIASSTSAALAFSQVQKNPDGIAALIVLSPNFGFDRWDSEMLLWPMARLWVPWVMGSYREFTPANPSQAEFWTTRYPYEAVVEVMRSVDLLRKTDLSDFKVPVLGFYSEKDQVVDPKKIKEGFDRLKAPLKKLVPISSSEDQHTLAGKILSPKMTQPIVTQILSFIKSLQP